MVMLSKHIGRFKTLKRRVRKQLQARLSASKNELLESNIPRINHEPPKFGRTELPDTMKKYDKDNVEILGGLLNAVSFRTMKRAAKKDGINLKI